MIGLKQHWQAIGGVVVPSQGMWDCLIPLGFYRVDLVNIKGKPPVAKVRDLLWEMTTHGSSRLSIQRRYVENLSESEMSTDEKLIEILSKVQAREVALVGWNEKDEVVGRLPTQIKKYSFYIER